jgi:hypothetical protein
MAEAERALAAAAAVEWPATAWSWRGDRARLLFLAARPATGARIAIDGGPAAGAWVELRLDGAFAGRAAAIPGTELPLAVPVSPGLHFLDVTSVAGGTAYPGRVGLAPVR